jgi:hypothetical protein
MPQSLDGGCWVLPPVPSQPAPLVISPSPRPWRPPGCLVDPVLGDRVVRARQLDQARVVAELRANGRHLDLASEVRDLLGAVPNSAAAALVRRGLVGPRHSVAAVERQFVDGLLLFLGLCVAASAVGVATATRARVATHERVSADGICEFLVGSARCSLVATSARRVSSGTPVATEWDTGPAPSRATCSRPISRPPGALARQKTLY